MDTYDRLVEKWSPVLNEESAGKISDAHKKAVTAVILENTEKALAEQTNQEQGFCQKQVQQLLVLLTGTLYLFH